LTIDARELNLAGVAFLRESTLSSWAFEGRAVPLGDDEPARPPSSIHRMNPHHGYDTVGTILNIHAMINGFLVETVQDVPETRMTEQPGTIVNHPAWTLSHLNAYAGVLLAMLDDPSVGGPTADAEMEQFGYGTTPVPDRAAYATKRELLDRFRDRNARLAAVVAAKHSDYFPRPAPKKFQPYSPTIGHIAITLLVAHPPHHLGQLRQWRRAAGIAERV
jgi:hypothetical protein